MPDGAEKNAGTSMPELSNSAKKASVMVTTPKAVAMSYTKYRIRTFHTGSSLFQGILFFQSHSARILNRLLALQANDFPSST